MTGTPTSTNQTDRAGMDESSKERLLTQFRTYLASASPLPPSATAGEERDPATDHQPAPDLYALFTELLALKNEVKLESRQIKNAMDEFKAVFGTLQASNNSLSRELEDARDRARSASNQALKPLLLELLDLRDRLDAGAQAFSRYQPPALASWLVPGTRQQTRHLESLRDGQEITLRRLDALLSAQRVQALSVVGKPLDPNVMRAAEIARREDLPDGVVTEELRRGYTREGELLRLAEVRVNKLAGDVTSADAPNIQRPRVSSDSG